MHDWDRGTGVCKYPAAEWVGPVLVAGEDQDEYPVGIVRYGSQY